MKARNTKHILLALTLPLVLFGCEIFGLDMQESYEYDYEAGIPDNNVHKDCWQFIESRTDLFSLLRDAVVYAKMETSFTDETCTYLLCTNTALNDYFSKHQVEVEVEDEETGEITYVMETPVTMRSYPVEQVREFLLYHTVQGKYTFTNVAIEPTWYKTYAEADTAKVNMYVFKDRNPNMTFNDFEGHYKTRIVPRTSNLQTEKGAYIHVIDSWLDRPTKKILGIK